MPETEEWPGWAAYPFEWEPEWPDEGDPLFRSCPWERKGETR